MSNNETFNTDNTIKLAGNLIATGLTGYFKLPTTFYGAIFESAQDIFNYLISKDLPEFINISLLLSYMSAFNYYYIFLGLFICYKLLKFNYGFIWTKINQFGFIKSLKYKIYGFSIKTNNVNDMRDFIMYLDLNKYFVDHYDTHLKLLSMEYNNYQKSLDKCFYYQLPIAEFDCKFRFYNRKYSIGGYFYFSYTERDEPYYIQSTSNNTTSKVKHLYRLKIPCLVIVTNKNGFNLNKFLTHYRGQQMKLSKYYADHSLGFTKLLTDKFPSYLLTNKLF